MKILRNPLVVLGGAYAVLWCAVYAYTTSKGFLSFQFVSEGLSVDPFQYDALARSLATHGTFSLDGVTPFFEREPGYSVFLAFVYLVFGVGSYVAVFAVQAILHFLATVAFVRSVRPFLARNTWIGLAALLLFSPPVFHALFALTRESLALSLCMFLTASLFSLRRSPSYARAALAGALLGVLLVVNVPFLLFPVGLAALLLWWRVPWTRVALCMAIAGAVLSPWVIRNERLRGMPCVTGCYREALQWHVRGEQAEHIGIGIEPAMCLWAEYVSRNWDDRSPYCSFNAVWHAKWPEGFVGVPADISVTKEGKSKILAHFQNYLWFSLFEVVELHLPYVNGWGRAYNVLAVLWTIVVYVGCVFSLRKLRSTEYLLFAAFMLYLTGIYSLTDATPRYLVPILHCYAFLAVLGYTGLRPWFVAPSSSRP